MLKKLIPSANPLGLTAIKNLETTVPHIAKITGLQIPGLSEAVILTIVLKLQSQTRQEILSALNDSNRSNHR
jgi:hypothetical protein